MSAISLMLDEEKVAAGDRLSGKLSCAIKTPPKEAKVELRWYTEGRGTPDSQVVDTYLLDPQQLTIGVPLAFSVATPAEGPITYNGSLLRILWEVRVSISFAGVLAKKETTARLVNVVCRQSR